MTSLPKASAPNVAAQPMAQPIATAPPAVAPVAPVAPAPQAAPTAPPVVRAEERREPPQPQMPQCLGGQVFDSLDLHGFGEQLSGGTGCSTREDLKSFKHVVGSASSG